MNVQAELSLYPLRTDELSGPIEAFCQALSRHGLEVHAGPMSTRVAGDIERLFAGLGEAFGQVARDFETVLIVKVSNACPENHGEHGP